MPTSQRSNGPPFQCDTPRASEIDVTSLRLSWNHVSEGPSPNCYRLHGQGADGSIVSETCSSNTVKVFGLNPGIGYIFTVSGTNRYGEGPRGYPSAKIVMKTYAQRPGTVQRGKHNEVSSLHNEKVLARRYNEIQKRPQLPEFADAAHDHEEILKSKEYTIASLTERLKAANQNYSATQSKLTHLHAQNSKKNEEPDSGDDLKAKLNQIQELKNDIHKLKTDSHNAKEKLEANIVLERSKTEKCCQEKEATEVKLIEKIGILELELRTVSAELFTTKEEKKQTGEGQGEILGQLERVKSARTEISDKLQECESKKHALKEKLHHVTEQYEEEQKAHKATHEAHEATQAELKLVKSRVAEAGDAKADAIQEKRETESKNHLLDMENKERHDEIVKLQRQFAKLESDNKRLVSENKELEIMMDAHDGVHVKVKAPAFEVEVEVEAPSFKVKAPSCEVEVEVKVATPKASGKRSGGKKAVKPKARAAHTQEPPIADDELTEKFFVDIFTELDEEESDFVNMRDYLDSLDKLIPRNANIQGLKSAFDTSLMILDKDELEEALEKWLEELHH